MTNLTPTERKVLDNMSKVLSPSVLLGKILQEIISAGCVEGTPVNAVAAKETLTFTGVVVDGETLTIDNPAKAGADVYEFVTDAAKTKTTPSNIAVDISANATKASCVLTMDTQPTSGDTITIGNKTYIFVPAGTANAVGEISIGADLAAAQAALVAAINGADNLNAPHPSVSIAPFAANGARVTAFIGGTAGNLIATIETFTAATNVFASATLTLGADCTAANAIVALVAAIVAHDTQGVTGVDGDGDTLILTADISGASGNDIVIGETMANAAFTGGATNLSGGIDGTVTSGIAAQVDDTYLYICLAENTVADSNWRRISLGNVF